MCFFLNSSVTFGKSSTVRFFCMNDTENALMNPNDSNSCNVTNEANQPQISNSSTGQSVYSSPPSCFKEIKNRSYKPRIQNQQNEMKSIIQTREINIEVQPDHESTHNYEYTNNNNNDENIKSIYSMLLSKINTLLNFGTQDKIDQNNFTSQIDNIHESILQIMYVNTLQKNEYFMDILIDNMKYKISKLKTKTKQPIFAESTDAYHIKQELNILLKQKQEMIQETNSIRSENAQLYNIPILNKPVIPSERRSPLLREMNKIRNLKNEIDRKEQILDYSKHQMDKEIAIITNSISTQEAEIETLLEKISNLEARNKILNFPKSLFKNEKEKTFTRSKKSNSISKGITIPQQSNQVPIIKPQKTAVIDNKKNNELNAIAEPQTISFRSPRMKHNRKQFYGFDGFPDYYQSHSLDKLRIIQTISTDTFVDKNDVDHDTTDDEQRRFDDEIGIKKNIIHNDLIETESDEEDKHFHTNHSNSNIPCNHVEAFPDAKSAFPTMKENTEIKIHEPDTENHPRPRIQFAPNVVQRPTIRIKPQPIPISDEDRILFNTIAEKIVDESIENALEEVKRIQHSDEHYVYEEDEHYLHEEDHIDESNDLDEHQHPDIE